MKKEVRILFEAWMPFFIFTELCVTEHCVYSYCFWILVELWRCSLSFWEKKKKQTKKHSVCLHGANTMKKMLLFIDLKLQFVILAEWIANSQQGITFARWLCFYLTVEQQQHWQLCFDKIWLLSSSNLSDTRCCFWSCQTAASRFETNFKTTKHIFVGKY